MVELNFVKSARPVIMGRSGIIASGHPLATLSGIRVLEDGGNAMDAALATSLTLTVVLPQACGLGGDLFALVYQRAKGEVEALNASGPAPAKATIEFFQKKGLGKIPASGPLSMAVPGFVDGWVKLQERYGTMERSRLAADAIHYARHGFPLYPALGDSISELAPSFPWIERWFRKSVGHFRPGGLLVQGAVADILERIVKEGRDGFYRGEVAARLCAGLEADGALIGERDLAGEIAGWLPPLSSTYRGFRLYEQPPVSQGFMVLEMLNILERYPLDTMSAADIIHVMVEAKKLAFEDRLRHLEDPRFGDPRIEMLISKDHAEKRGALIESSPRQRTKSSGTFGSDTTYLCAADREGNVVSVIQSIFAHFGSRVVAGDTGIVMNNRLCSFLLDRKRANALEPGKRPAHTLNSYMIFKDDKIFGVGGTPGADDQPQSNVQILSRLLDFRLDPQTAVELPRWSHAPGTRPQPGDIEELRMEEGFETSLVEELRRKGHQVTVVGPWSFGGASVIIRDPGSGTWMAGADPRREGYALGF